MVWLAGTELRQTGARGTASRGVLTARGRVLLFDAARDARGICHVAAVVHVDDRVDVVAGRFENDRLHVATLASVPAVGGWDTHGDGIIAYRRSEEYESLQVVGGTAGSTRVVWTDGRAAFAGLLRHDGRVEGTPLHLPARRVAAAADATGRLHVLGVGQPGCFRGGIFCNPHVAYGREGPTEWPTTNLGRATEEVPVIFASGSGRIRALRAGAHTMVLDPLDPERRWVIGAGPTDGEPFVWSTLVDVGGEPWLVAVSRLGTVHALPVGDLPPSPGQSWDRAPLLDLFSLTADATRLEAAATDSEILIAWSTPGRVHLRRAPVPALARRWPAIRTWEARPEQVPLTDGAAFGDVHRIPHTGFWAGANVSAGPNCVHPLSATVRVNSATVVLPSTATLRLAHPASDGWQIEERRIEPPILGDPHQQLTAPSGRSLQTYSAGCPDRQVAYAPPGPARTQRVPVSPDGRWVGVDDRSAYVALPDRVVRIAWATAGDATAAIRVEPVTALPAGVDRFSIRVRDGGVAFGIPRDEIVVVGGSRLHADGGAYAVAGDGTIVVRRNGRLVAGSRFLAATDALPLAAARRSGGMLEVALRTPRGALVLAEFAEGGGVAATFVHACSSGEPRAAQFIGDHLLVGCER